LLWVGEMMMLLVFVIVLLVGEGKKLSFRGRPKQPRLGGLGDVGV